MLISAPLLTDNQRRELRASEERTYTTCDNCHFECPASDRRMCNRCTKELCEDCRTDALADSDEAGSVYCDACCPADAKAVRELQATARNVFERCQSGDMRRGIEVILAALNEAQRVGIERGKVMAA